MASPLVHHTAMAYAIAMSNRDELIQAQSAMLTVLDEKLRDMPEWRAFRAMGKAITALDGSLNGSESPPSQPSVQRVRLGPRPTGASYADLARLLLEQAGRPLPSSELIPAIAQRRGVDPAEKRVVISTALSRDEGVTNIRWRNGTAWWLTGRDLPQEAAHAGPQPRPVTTQR